jgi:hypothetical protein
MSNLAAMCKQIVEHVDNGDLMTALDFFENTMLPYHEKMTPSEDPVLYELVTELDGTVENEDWNESLEIVDKISEHLNG